MKKCFFFTLLDCKYINKTPLTFLSYKNNLPISAFIWNIALHNWNVKPYIIFPLWNQRIKLYFVGLRNMFLVWWNLCKVNFFQENFKPLQKRKKGNFRCDAYFRRFGLRACWNSWIYIWMNKAKI